MKNSKPIQIGITGGIGSGKSTIAQLFEEMEVPVYYADSEAKELMNIDSDIKGAIIKLFGEEAYKEGQLNRAFIASKVFGNETKLAQLNAIVHPKVAKHFEEWVTKQFTKFVIKEAAILVETGGYKELDELFVVTADENLRIQRVMKRDSVAKDLVESRIKNQISDAERNQYATWIFKNNEGDDLKLQVAQCWEYLKEKYDE
jgi:dephospho-CoA kinase